MLFSVYPVFHDRYDINRQCLYIKINLHEMCTQLPASIIWYYSNLKA